MDIKKLLLGFSKQLDETLPAARKSTIPAEVAPEVLGKGTSRASNAATDALDAELIPKKVSTLESVKQFAKDNPGKVVGGLTLAELARQMTGGENQPTMMTPPPMEAKGMEESKGESLAEVAKPTEIKDAGKPQNDQFLNKSDMESKLDNSMAGLPKEAAPVPQELDFAKLLQEAQGKKDKALQDASLLRHAEMFSSGLARTATNHGSSDIARKLAEKPVENTKELISAHKEQQSYNKAKAELDDDAKLRDPNSEVSKLTSEIAAKAGLIQPGMVMSAMALKNSGVNLGNLLNTIEAGKARKETARLQHEYLMGLNGEKNKNKEKESSIRQVTNALKSKDYEAYNAAKDAEFALDHALETGDKTASGAAFMQYAKIAQGDNSVVRDGDMAQLAGRYNYTSPKEMITKLAAKASGGNFNASELKQMREISQLTKGIKAKRIGKLLSPVVKRSEAHGFDLAEVVDPSIVEEFSKPEFGLAGEEKSQGGKSPYSPQEEAGISAFMQAKGISRDEAVSKLKAGGRLK